jgi:hypothetical protein
MLIRPFKVAILIGMLEERKLCMTAGTSPYSAVACTSSADEGVHKYGQTNIGAIPQSSSVSKHDMVVFVPVLFVHLQFGVRAMWSVFGGTFLHRHVHPLECQ